MNWRTRPWPAVIIRPFNFLQWYVAEQHEEEKLFKSVIDKLTLAGKSGEGLYFIDKELATLDAQN